MGPEEWGRKITLFVLRRRRVKVKECLAKEGISVYFVNSSFVCQLFCMNSRDDGMSCLLKSAWFWEAGRGRGRYAWMIRFFSVRNDVMQFSYSIKINKSKVHKWHRTSKNIFRGGVERDLSRRTSSATDI